jgi:DNA-binding response OmpR family regulator
MRSAYSIILIEDSRDDVFLVREALSMAGLDCKIRVVEDGGEAPRVLKMLGTELPPPDLFLVDLNLPKANGFQLIRLIRENPQCVTTPIIVMSSSGSQRDRAEARLVGATEYFSKPLELDEFMKLGELVRALLDQNTLS